MVRRSGMRTYQSIPPVDVVDEVEVGGGGFCTTVMAVFSFLLAMLFFPFSLCYTIKVS